MSLNNEIISELKKHGAGFVHFADISQLSAEQSKGYRNAVLIGIALSADYIRKVADTSDYVEQLIKNKNFDQDEFLLKERKADSVADHAANYLVQKGYPTYSQSEDNIYLTGFYNQESRCTPLPHKTIALLAGIGWIGKNNLLVIPEFGSAFCMCTLLTDAPFDTTRNNPVVPKCGSCHICTDICAPQALKGNSWTISTPREQIVDVYNCTTCLKCLVLCPWTQAYMKKNIK